MPKSSLTFFFGTKKPFIQLDGRCKKKNKYIILPWNINTAIGKDNLRNMINKIPSKGKSLIYTIYVSDENKNTIKNTLEDSINTFRDLSLSQASFQDDTDKLYDKIDELNKKLKISEEKLTNAKAEAERKREDEKIWIASLPVRNIMLNSAINVAITKNGYEGKLRNISVKNVHGDVELNIPSRTLIITGKTIEEVNFR